MSRRKVCIVGSGALSRMPYMRHYKRVLEGLGIGSDVYYWARDGEKVPQVPGYYAFRHAPKQGSLIARVFGNLRYVVHMRRELAGRSYAGVICLGISSAIALPCSLRRSRYIVDIRDYSGEWLPPYRWMERRLLRRAGLVCISSAGFRRWLPEGLPYCLVHNCSPDFDAESGPPFDRGTQVIAHVGIVAYGRSYAPFLLALRECAGFTMRFAGDGPDRDFLERFCHENAVANVEFTGEYMPDEKAKHIVGCNFLTALYGAASLVTTTALPNKLYDAAVYRRPLVVSAGTFLADTVRESGLGIVFDSEEPRRLRRELEEWYSPGRLEDFNQCCDRFLGKVRDDMTNFYSKLRTEFLSWSV